MAFVASPTLGDSIPTVEQRGLTFLAASDVAIDIENDQLLLLEVCLTPHIAGDVELAFFLTMLDGTSGDEIDRIFDGRRTRHLAPLVDRMKILKAVMLSVAALVESAKPERVFMCAMEVVPAKAEAKYIAVAHVLERMGYEVKNADSYHGRRAWWAYRLVKP